MVSSTRSGDVIEVDIRTRVLKSTDKFHILFPGESHSLYEAMAENEFVFLDIPALELEGVSRFAELGHLKERISRSDAIRAWIREGAPDASRPDYDLAAYSNTRTSQRKALLAGAIERLYFDMKPGDIVIVPGPGYHTDVFIGEIVGETTYFRNPHLYGDMPIPARRVKWLAKRQKRFFSEEMIARLGTPNFLIQLDRSLRDEVLRIAFDNYVLDGVYVTKFSTTEYSFNTLDEFQIQAFINFVAGALVAAENGGATAHSLTLEEAVEILAKRPDLAPSLAVNINSPGWFTVFDENVRPLALAVFLALAVAGHSDASPATVRVVNSSAPPTDQCAVQVDQAVKDAFTLMNYDAWKKACYRAQEAKKSTGFDASVKVAPAAKIPEKSTLKQ